MANRRRIRIILSAALILGFAVLAWLFIAHTRGPVYGGKTLTAWLDESYDNGGIDPQAEAAIRAMGADALPTLLKMIRTTDSGLRGVVLNLSVKYKWFPVHLRPSVEIRFRGFYGFHALGRVAKPAIPALIRLLDNDNAHVRGCADAALADIGPDSRDAVPAIIRNLRRALPQGPAKWWNEEMYCAACALGRIGAPASPAIPELTQLANAPGSEGSMAQVALAQIRGESMLTIIESLTDISNASNWNRGAGIIYFWSTNAEAAVPPLIAALQHANDGIRAQALRTLSGVRSHPELCIPAATPLLQSTDMYVRLNSINLIRAFGPAGKTWFPLSEMVRCLSDPDEDVRKRATNALREIAPEALPNK